MDNSESSQKFKIGDVVQLKSGGPTMTVSKFGDDNRVYCVWFAYEYDKYDKYHDGYFLPDSLKLIVK